VTEVRFQCTASICWTWHTSSTTLCSSLTTV